MERNVTKKSRGGIACGGNWIIDRVKSIDLYPAENSIAEVIGTSQCGGGCCHNVAIDLALLDPDLPVSAFGMVGDDPEGDWLLDECRRHPNLDASGIRRTDQARTSSTDVFSVRGTGSRTFFHDRGANRLFGPDTVDVEQLEAEIFHLGYLLLLDEMDKPDGTYGRVSAHFLNALQSRGIRTSIDLVSADVPDFADKASPALKYTDYCIINDLEAERLTGVPVRKEGAVSLAGLEGALSALFDGGVAELAVIHFPEGACARTRTGGILFQPSLDLPPGFIVGGTGAGDAFCSGMLFGLWNGWKLKDCLEFAACAGAQNLNDLTTVGSMTRWKEIIKLKDQYPFRRSPD
jgi:sugar/nucleoside kinase (ribokinase family)